MARQLALHRAHEQLLDAMACVHEIRLAGPDGNVKTRHWSLQANQHVREVAASSAATPELIDWQIGAVRAAYQALLGAE